jgi:hypothetical protein
MAKRERWLSHLSYEIEQMGTLARWLEDIQSVATTYPGDRGGLDDLRNACLEACLVHVRLLSEFLVGRRKKGPQGTVYRTRNAKDVQPADLSLTGDWDVDGDDPAVALLDRALPDLDRHLGHLSKKRADIVALLGWEPGELARAVCTLMARFAALTDESTRCTIERALKAGAVPPQAPLPSSDEPSERFGTIAATLNG